MSCNIRKTQMMAAACNNERQTAPVAKELQGKLAQMQAERTKQDLVWSSAYCEEGQTQGQPQGQTQPIRK